MFFLETCHIPRTKGTLVIDGDAVCIQTLLDDDITICEWVIPVLHYTQCMEVFVTIDEKVLELLEYSSTVRVDKHTLYFGNISYTFTSGEYLTWETRLPQLVCIMNVPRIPNKGPLCICTVDDAHFNMKINNMTWHHKTFQNFNKASATFQTLLLTKIFDDNQDKICKVYLEDNFPICIEFSYPIKRYYIAPCVDSELDGEEPVTCVDAH